MSNEEENGKDEVSEPTVIGKDEGDDDAPDLGISVGVEDGNVIIVFSQRLTTVGMPPDAADQMGDALKKHAADARAMRSD